MGMLAWAPEFYLVLWGPIRDSQLVSRALKGHTGNTSTRPQTFPVPCLCVAFDGIEFSQSSKLTSATDLWLTRGKGGWEGMEWEFGVSRCKLLHIEWINNKVLLYSTGNYSQYPLINHNGKEYKKDCIYMYN